jgi:hypothetical protein
VFDVDIELYEPIDEVTERLIDGRVQLAYGVTEHVILNRENGGSLLIIGGNVNKLAFSLMANNLIKKPEDLRDKTIGVSSLNAGSSSLIMQTLEIHELYYPKDYSITEVGPIVLSRRSSGFFIRLFAIRENANLLTFPPIIKREPPFSRLRITCSVTPYAS